jgi:hypothetical protein
MASYDPQRSRSRRRAADEEGPAPVDEILDRGPGAGDQPDASTALPSSLTSAVEPATTSPAEPAPGPTVTPVPPPGRTVDPKVVVVVIVALLALLVGLGRRRRRRRRRALEAGD